MSAWNAGRLWWQGVDPFWRVLMWSMVFGLTGTAVLLVAIYWADQAWPTAVRTSVGTGIVIAMSAVVSVGSAVVGQAYGWRIEDRSVSNGSAP